MRQLSHCCGFKPLSKSSSEGFVVCLRKIETVVSAGDMRFSVKEDSQGLRLTLVVLTRSVYCLRLNRNPAENYT